MDDATHTAAVLLGRLGGQKLSQKISETNPDGNFYRVIGKKGGQTTSRKYSREYFSEIGKKGAAARTKESRKAGGKKGGMKMAERGAAYFRELALRGVAKRAKLKEDAMGRLGE